ncbi:MAG: 50S ribosomal protein L17 [Bacteroidota bacterium]
MRHGKRFNHLGRTASHRNAMLSNMASSLITNKRITTTVAKAKALRKYVEPLLTKSKDDTTHSRRTVFSYLQNKESVKTLFDEISAKISDRPGGYTRIIRIGNRLGDNAEMCIIELVDYNELLLSESKPAKAKTRRSRRGGGKKAPAAEAKETVVEEAVEVETVEATEVEEPTTEEEPKEAAVEETTDEETKVVDETKASEETTEDDVDEEEKKPEGDK